MSTSVYLLNHGAKGVEERRLNKIHRCWGTITKRSLPEHIHEHLLSREHVPAVADVGTGTGIWLNDLASELPSNTRLDGYDFDVSKFPDPSALPPNVKLSFADALKPFPAELQGQYDCVHIRLFIVALKADQWEMVAANLRTLLRPGGWLIWDELYYYSRICLPMTENFQKWLSVELRYAISVGIDILAPTYLLEKLESQGYVNCSKRIFSSLSHDKEFQRLTGESVVENAIQFMHGIVEAGGFDWAKTHEVVDDVVKGLYEDLDAGCIMGWQFQWTMGQNPEN